MRPDGPGWACRPEPIRREEGLGMREIVAALARMRAPVVLGEHELHGIVAHILDDAGIAYEREKRVGRCRLDFLCRGGVAIEIKRGKPNRVRLVAQLGRYAVLDEVCALIAVSEAAVGLPKAICGKPVCCVPLRALWGVALP